mgnify:CR=1 FL=1
MKQFIFLLISIIIFPISLMSQHKKFEKLLNDKKNQKISKNIFSKLNSMKLFSGFFNFYYDENTDHIFLIVKDLNNNFYLLYFQF